MRGFLTFSLCLACYVILVTIFDRFKKHGFSSHSSSRCKMEEI